MSPDQIVTRTPLVTVGRFRCPVDHEAFRDSGPIRQSCVVFPRTAVVIAHEGAASFVADPAVVTLYNTGQRYERRPISPEGDRCDWYAVTPDLLREAVRPFEPAAADDPDRVLRRSHARVDARMYLEQRRFFHGLERQAVPDPLGVDEAVLAILRRVLERAYGRRPGPGQPGGRAARQRADLVHAACRLLARGFRQPIHLSALARTLGCSPFHLCRAFRGVTGSTLHAHATTLRLRASLEPIAAGADLTTVALDAGFSSHSHFTAAFRRAFGVTPSRAAGQDRDSRRTRRVATIRY